MKTEVNKIIKKSNDLISAKYRLTILQQYVLHDVISQIHINDADFKKYELNIQSIAENHGIDSKNAYRSIKQAALDLNKLQIIIGDAKEGLALTWFTSVLYNSARGSLLIDFHKDLKPYLLQLKSYFTQYEHHNVKQFRCVHSLRFYEFLKQKQHLGSGKGFYVELSIAEIRSMLCFSNSEYKANKDLRVNVIEKALKEINEQTDLKILDTQFLKVGRSIDSIYIAATPKPQPRNKKQRTVSPPVQDTVEEQSNIQEQKTLSRPKFSDLMKQQSSTNANTGDLESRRNKITALIMSNGLTARFKQADESGMQMMRRIQSEITSDEIADQWQSKLEEFGVVFGI